VIELRLTDELQRIQRGLPGFFRGEARYLSQLVTREVAQRTPIGRQVDQRTGRDRGPSGRLRASWRPLPTKRDGDTYSAGTMTDVEYAPYVENDTRRHIIPKGGSAAGIVLHFWTHGQEVFARSVDHPGTRGAYMQVRGLNEAERRYKSEMDARLKRFLEGQERA
jgi:hypothetical protein